MAFRKALRIALVATLAVAPAAARAQDCSSQVQSAEESARQQYIQGMAGLANNNFSQRPGSFSSMACLDKFMQGNMDTLFRPPQLNDLLGQVLNFACQQAKQAVSGALGGGGMGGLNLQSMLGSLSGGINIPGASGGANLMNLSSMLGGGASGNSYSTSTGGISSLFGGR